MQKEQAIALIKGRIIGIICIIWSMIFGHLETVHFGNNWFPQTNDEIICDITSFMLCVAGIVLIMRKQTTSKQE